MARTPEEVEALFRTQHVPGHLGPQLNGADEDGIITEEERTWRVLKLKEVLVTARQAWDTNDDVLDLITEKLADGSRDGELVPFALASSHSSFSSSWDSSQPAYSAPLDDCR
jgi:hypothetical protein